MQGTDYLQNLCHDTHAIYRIPDVYWILCECRKVYVGQNVRTNKARWNEHQRSICLYQPESAATEHSINTHHCINFSCTSTFNRTSGYVDSLVKEATEIHLNKNNFNRDSRFILSQVWSPIINMLMKSNMRIEQSMYLTPPTNHRVSPPATMGRYIMMQTDVRGSQFPDGEDRDGPSNVCYLTIHPPDTAARPRTFY